MPSCRVPRVVKLHRTRVHQQPVVDSSSLSIRHRYRLLYPLVQPPAITTLVHSLRRPVIIRFDIVVRPKIVIQLVTKLGRLISR